MTAPRTAARPVRSPRPAAAPARPRLRVVPPGELTTKGRRRRARRLVVLTGFLLGLCLLGVVASHVVLTQNQFRLEQLEARAGKARAEYDRLRLEVARLESPERIVAAAKERLGMVAPEEVTYLAPKGERPRAPAGATAERRAMADGDVPAATASGWTVVKRHLDGRP